MSASDESEAEMSRIKGTRKRKLRNSRQACTARLPARGRRYRWRGKTDATWSGVARLEDCTLGLRATPPPVGGQHEEEAHDSPERARLRSPAHLPDGCQGPGDMCGDHVRGRGNIGRLARDLIDQ